ncbi:MAG: hypothetical protein CMF11_02240 [Idiomarina sp.]|nr:hypothetical protein [Idiomarina sp.]
MTTTTNNDSNIITLVPRDQERNRIADAFIAKARQSCAWPTKVGLENGVTTSGLEFPGKAVVAAYADGSRKAHGVVGARYTPAGVAAWEETVRAAVQAGAEPVTSDIMGGGANVFAGFKVGGDSGFTQFFHLLDDLSGHASLLHMGTTFRVICKNQQAQYRPSATAIRHTASIEDRLDALRENMDDVIRAGHHSRRLYDRARDMTIDGDDVQAILHHLFPTADDATRRQASNARRQAEEVIRCAALRVNQDGPSLATLWNGLTYSVDRTSEGVDRAIRQTQSYTRTRAELHLLGSRGQQVRRYQRLVEAVTDAGSVEAGLESLAA